MAACAAWGNCIAKHASFPTKNGMGRHAAFQKQMFVEPSESRSGGLKNQIVAEVGVQGFLEPSETAYSGKFMQRRSEWKRGGRGRF